MVEEASGHRPHSAAEMVFAEGGGIRSEMLMNQPHGAVAMSRPAFEVPAVRILEVEDLEYEDL